MNKMSPPKRVFLAMGNRYNERIHHGVALAAREYRWHLTNLFGDSPSLISNRECDGIIAVIDRQEPLTKTILNMNRPIVDLSIIHDQLPIPHLTGDNRNMGRAAANHFIERGFHNFICYSENDHKPAKERKAAFIQTLKTARFNCTSLIVKNRFGPHRPHWRELSDWIIQELHRMTLPCAVYAYNDVQAVDFVDACVTGGFRIPDEVAILGTDNHTLICETTAVPLSSINHDLEAMGRQAAKKLSKLMEGGKAIREIIEIPHRGITIRQSSDIFSVNDQAIVKALRYMHANFSRLINIEEIADYATISRRSLERRFMKTTNQSVHQELTRIRLQAVCRLLHQTNRSIADIASVCGFNTPEYLHRIFKKEMNQTPRSFRMQKIADPSSSPIAGNEPPGI